MTLLMVPMDKHRPASSSEAMWIKMWIKAGFLKRALLAWGGGVSHHQVKVPDEDADGPGLADDYDDSAEQPDPHLPHTPDASDVESEDEEDGPPEGSQEESDEGDDESGDEEEEEEEEEDDFGPEDGENGEDDFTVQLGYDEL
ncbi:hypothetical protein DFH09DRAFT_1376317 [Mycena vulgaris]|nr:hypothetical protein DFH09DRAFT_1376317 [Mycena vulgaris]